MEWNDGMDYWSGALDWTTGVPRPQISCILGRAHNTKSLQGLHYMYEPKIISCLVRNLQQVSPTLRIAIALCSVIIRVLTVSCTVKSRAYHSST